MLKSKNKYLSTISIFIILILILNLSICYYGILQIEIIEVLYIHVFFIIITFFIIFLHKKIIKKKVSSPLIFLSLNFFKMLASVVFLLPVIKNYTDNLMVYIINFFAVYFLYLFIELTINIKVIR